MTTTMDELNAQIEDLEEQVQQLRNEKVKRKLFNHFDIQEEDLEGITNFRLQSSYTRSIQGNRERRPPIQGRDLELPPAPLCRIQMTMATQAT